MNYAHILAQPVYYYSITGEIKPNLRKTPVLLDEIVVLADEVEILKEIKDMYPFIHLIKAVEEEVDRNCAVRGYYLTGEFDLRNLKTAIEKRLVCKRCQHIAFSDIPLSKNMEQVAISWDDTHILVEFGRSTRLIPRRKM